MMRLSRIFVALAFLLLLAIKGSRHIAKAEESIAGRWAGTISEEKVGKYTVFVEIHPNHETGVVHYLRYPCGGKLSMVSQTGNSYLYREWLTFGQEKCMNNLQVRITWKDPNLVYFEEITEGSSVVTGNLKRIVDVSALPKEASPPLPEGDY